MGKKLHFDFSLTSIAVPVTLSPIKITAMLILHYGLMQMLQTLVYDHHYLKV